MENRPPPEDLPTFHDLDQLSQELERTADSVSGKERNKAMKLALQVSRLGALLQDPAEGPWPDSLRRAAARTAASIAQRLGDAAAQPPSKSEGQSQLARLAQNADALAETILAQRRKDPKEECFSRLVIDVHHDLQEISRRIARNEPRVFPLDVADLHPRLLRLAASLDPEGTSERYPIPRDLDEEYSEHMTHIVRSAALGLAQLGAKDEGRKHPILRSELLEIADSFRYDLKPAREAPEPGSTVPDIHATRRSLIEARGIVHIIKQEIDEAMEKIERLPPLLEAEHDPLLTEIEDLTQSVEDRLHGAQGFLAVRTQPDAPLAPRPFLGYVGEKHVERARRNSTSPLLECLKEILPGKDIEIHGPDGAEIRRRSDDKDSPILATIPIPSWLQEANHAWIDDGHEFKPAPFSVWLQPKENHIRNLRKETP